MTTSALEAGLTTGTWNIDPVHSTVGFSVKHMMVSKVRGTFDEFTGQISVDGAGEASVVADIKVESLNTSNERRDEHVRSADYFSVDEHPVAHFRSTSVTHNGETYVLVGDFTLRGHTKQVEMDLELTGVHGDVAGFEATAVINRKDFSITTDMPLDGGGKAVGDKITITIDAQARRED